MLHEPFCGYIAWELINRYPALKGKTGLIIYLRDECLIGSINNYGKKQHSPCKLVLNPSALIGPN
jgi:hypothetical protein